MYDIYHFHQWLTTRRTQLFIIKMFVLYLGIHCIIRKNFPLLAFCKKNFQLAPTPKNKQLKLPFYPFLIWKQLNRNTFLISLTFVEKAFSIFHVFNAFSRVWATFLSVLLWFFEQILSSLEYVSYSYVW